MKPPSRIEMEDFKSILSQEIAIYNKIEQHLSTKKQVIIDGDLQALEQIDTELEKLTQTARMLEQSRIGMLIRMGKEGATLRQFIASLETGEDARMLAHAREQLVRTTQSIKQLSKTNQDLLTQSIRFIEQSVDVIASILAPEGASYSNRRVKNQERPPSEATITMPSTICHDI